MAQISNCLKIISKLDERDQDALVARLDEIQAHGVPAERAQIQAAIDVMARLERAAAPAVRSVARQTDTPEFKRWFGDSKVVDAQGQPLVVYHGTTADFSVFDAAKIKRKAAGTGFYFTTDREQRGYAEGEGASVMPVYLSIQNPTANPFLFRTDESYDGLIFPLTSTPGVTHMAVRRAEQIKSAIGNSGAFDPADADITRSVARPQFYSQLQRAIEQVPDRLATMAAPQWKLWLDANAPKLGVKKDEIEFSGVTDYLALRGKEKVSRDDLVAYLADSGVRVTEVQLGGQRLLDDGAKVNYSQFALEQNPQRDPEMLGEITGRKTYDDGITYYTVQWANGNEGTMHADNVQPVGEVKSQALEPRYAEYAVPGGENYREVLITLPVVDPDAATELEGAKKRLEAMSEIAAEFESEGNQAKAESFQKKASALQDKISEMEKKVQPKLLSNYKSSHFDQLNILAHLRVDDRVDADGARVLFLNEIQSDWGQDGKKKGFKPLPGAAAARLADAKRLIEEGRQLERAMRDRVRDFREENPEAEQISDELAAWRNEQSDLIRERMKQAQAARDEANELTVADGNGLPRAPFVQDTKAWAALALKRAIMMAIEGGYDKIAMIRGDQAAGLYSLDKQVDELVLYDDNTVVARKDGANVVERKFKTDDELAEIVGKDVAAKLLATKRDMNSQRILRGDDLKVEATGMRKFYDELIPLVARDVLKKLGGGKLEQVVFGGDDESGRYVVFDEDSGDRLFRTDSRAEANEYVQAYPGDATIQDVETSAGVGLVGEQLGFEITDAMREKVSAGVPLFSRTRGWAGFPDAIVATPPSTQSKDASYEAAKAGDMKAALELVDRVLPADIEQKIRDTIGDSKPIVAAVHAEEAAGRNKIPLAAAFVIGERMGLQVDDKLAQASRAKRTGSSGMARLGVQPEFAGAVEQGADYLLVDDTLAQGGTLAQLKTHIENNGGRVVGVFALSGKQYSAKLSLDESTLSDVRAKYEQIEDWRERELGFDFAGLTQSEARYILKSGLSPDALRDQVTAARQAAGLGAGQEDTARLSRARGPQTDTPAFKAWFGDSKVVDADGKPMAVYHGTGADFSRFGSGRGAIYFTADPEVASAYADNADAEDIDGEDISAPNVMPVYLSLQKPLVLDEAWAKENLDYDGERDWMTLDNAVYQAEQDGHDGVILRGVVDFAGMDGETRLTKPYDQFIVFRPEQIKSATGNSGAFDPLNADITQSKGRTTGDYGRMYTKEQQEMFKNTGRTVAPQTLMERVKEARSDMWKKMAQGIVDQFRPIRDLGGDAYTLARLSKGSAGAFEALLNYGKLSIVDGAYDADMSGGFIKTIGEPLGAELEDFAWWIASNRAERLAIEDRENLFSRRDIDAGKSLATGTMPRPYTKRDGTTTTSRAEAYADSLEKFNEFNKNVLDIAEQSGLIDADARKIWENEFYVPFYRVSEEDGQFMGAKIKGGLARQRAFQELKGGSQKLNSDLLANTMKNWAHLIDASAKNRAAKATLEAAEMMNVAIEADAETVRQLGKNIGGKGGTVWFMDSGQQRHFVVGDPHLMAAINSLEYAGLRGPIMDALSATKHWLTVGVTASPAFKVRNLIRDSLQAISVTDLSYNPIANLKDGIKASARDNQTYVSALASGGLIRFGTMMEGNGPERVRRLVQKGVHPSTILDSEAKVKAFYSKTIEPIVDAYNELGNRGEEINRAALFEQLKRQGVSHAEAALLSRDMMDFSMQGTWASIRFLTQVVPFLNARLQGLYKLGRGAAENPQKFAITTGAVALVSIALMAAYQDDEDWKKREDWDRDGNWWFKVGSVAFRIPKPFEIGAIGTLAERGVELFTNDEFTLKRFLGRVKHIASDNLAMNPVPQALKPIIDVYANKDAFNGRPIESMGMERLQAEYRYTASTSMVARGASTALNTISRNTLGEESLSPVQIDSMLRGYFGWLGTFIVGGADMVIRPLANDPARPQADYFKVVTQGIARQVPEPSSKYVSAVYDQAKILEEAYATHRQLIREGKVDDAREFAEDNADLLRRHRVVERVKGAQSQINRTIREIERSDKDPKTKRDEIQVLRDRQSRIAAEVY